MQKKSPIYSNFKRNLKWLGIIEYKSLVIMLIYLFVIFTILRKININIDTKIYIFSFMFTPIFILFIMEKDNLNASDLIIYMFKFFIKRCIYVSNFGLARKFKGAIYVKNKDLLKSIVKSRK